jgi:hypothetical protein
MYGPTNSCRLYPGVNIDHLMAFTAENELKPRKTPADFHDLLRGLEVRSIVGPGIFEGASGVVSLYGERTQEPLPCLRRVEATKEAASGWIEAVRGAMGTIPGQEFLRNRRRSKHEGDRIVSY